MTTHYITGRHDRIKRRVFPVAPLPDEFFTRGYQVVELELYPGKFVRQIVGSDRIQKRADGAQA